MDLGRKNFRKYFMSKNSPSANQLLGFFKKFVRVELLQLLFFFPFQKPWGCFSSNFEPTHELGILSPTCERE